MPRRVRFRTAIFEEWERQLAFAPEPALRRHMEAAEALSADLDRGATYPFEFVQWRVTGYRAENPTLDSIDGATLQGELAAFVQRLSERLLPAELDREGGAVTISDLAAEWGVAEKTIRRWRDRGLLSHRIRFADGRTRLGCFRASASRFAERHREVLEEARGFSRMDPASTRAALEAVERGIAQGRTPNLAARDVARSLGRSHEAIRQLLLKRTMASPRRGGDRATRQRQFCWRAWRWGIPVEAIAERLVVPAASVRRSIDLVRAERLRRLSIRWIEYATFERPDADDTILAAPAARTDLRPRLVEIDAIRSLESRRSTSAEQPVDDEAMLAAYNWLKRRAATAIRAFVRVPDRTELDRVETDLRWAAMLKRRLLERWLPVAVERVEQSIGGSLVRRPNEEIRRLLEACVAVADDVAESADPSRRHVPRRMVALEVDRALARMTGLKRELAAARGERSPLPMEEILRRGEPWTTLIDRRLPALFDRAQAPPADAALLARRYGREGPPGTIVELAREERTSPTRVARRLAAAEAALRRGASPE